MKVLNGKGLIQITSCTFTFTGMMANPSACTWKRMLFFEQLKRFFVFSVINQRYESLDTDMRGTGCLAWSGTKFAYGICTGNCLGILLVYGLSVGKPFIIIIRNIYRAYFCTFPAACAFGKVYIPWCLFYPGSKAAGITFEFYKFCIGKKFYI